MSEKKEKRKIRFFKREKPQLTYEEAHNKAYWKYSKAAGIFIWAGILNVVGLIFAIIQYHGGATLSYDFYLCFLSNTAIFRLFALTSLDIAPLYVIYFVIACASSSGLILCSVFAKQGKKNALFIGTIIYFIDLFCAIPSYFLGENVTNLWLSIAIHIIISSFSVIAIYEYFHIIRIAEKYGKIKTNKPEPKEDKENGNI